MVSDPLLPQLIPMAGVVDYRGRPVTRYNSGGWSSAVFVIGVEMAERSAYYGISLNMITYLTDELGESTAAAAASVTMWTGTVLMMPLLGAFLADSCLGRYPTIVASSLLYVLGLGTLTLSSILPNLQPQLQVPLFYVSLYIVAFAQGGHKPALQALGADQFDENDPQECVSRSSFFNWWYCGMNVGMIGSFLVLSYLQDNIGWGLGFAIPCILMVIAAIAFLIGTRRYRCYPLEVESPFARIGRAFLAMAKNGGAHSIILDESRRLSKGEAKEKQYLLVFDQSNVEDNESAPSIVQVEEAKAVLRLFPIWISCVVYAIVYSQSSTFFTKQGGTMDGRIGSSFQVPPAALQSLIFATIVVFLPIYDRVLVPTVRNVSKKPSGFSLLQRIGTGVAFSVVAMVVAALVETKRLNTARECGLIDRPNETIPMSLWWLVPQYILFGVAESFAMVGLQEFFYDQVPDTLRSLGIALFLSIFGVGRLISSFLVTAIDGLTQREGESWFSNNLNRAHLDYFYWLLAGLGATALTIYLFFAQAYVYKNKVNAAL
ncbi:protein NRT1/ PTR FAMILY 5.10-like isoform X2 [Iris pallida]|uniref:Protein NRT1/ PTR FAMILY 5.10-like isoform X2 n=1 Tax=Iris pallida TaxID=29817 RepID=A0AAX6H6S7_IRIPA|nr:protein NRT1/ PTR FAMILY 5.10-like isoform X2 [Iris pallida]